MFDKKKKIIFFIIFIAMIGMQTIVSGKYVIEITQKAIGINLDKTPPVINALYMSNDNITNIYRIDKSNEINLYVRIEEKNIKENNLEKGNIKVLVDKKEIDTYTIQAKKEKKGEDYITYCIKISGIEGNGNLSIIILKDTVIDKSMNSNDEVVILTDMEVVNN